MQHRYNLRRRAAGLAPIDSAVFERVRATADAQAQTILDRTPSRVARTPRIMGEAYGYIFRRLLARGFGPPRARLKLGKATLLLIVARCFLR